MSARLPPLNALKAFEAAARHLSLKRAAAELSVTPGAISHQIKVLEDYLGIQLFRRLNRALELTPPALSALPYLRDGFNGLARAVGMMRPNSVELVVSVAPSFAMRWLMPRFPLFLTKHPEINVRLSARMRLTSTPGRDNASSLERATIENWLEKSDIAILYGDGDYPGYRVEKLLDLSVAPMCSPKLMRGKHPLKQPQDLQHHTLIHYGVGEHYDGKTFWEVWLAAAGVERIDTKRGSHFSQLLAIEAARNGLGVVATLPMFASAELADGSLVLPFRLQVPLHTAYHMVSRKSKSSYPAVTAFRNWLLAEAKRDAA